MELAQAGDREAYRSLLDDLGPAVMAYLRRRLAAQHEIDDVYQEVLLAIHLSRHTYEPGRPVEPWVFAIAGHVLARQVGARRDAPRVKCSSMRCRRSLCELPRRHARRSALACCRGSSAKR
jgi:RNA polymerase sigma-70 factor (ECF subfamily)